MIAARWGTLDKLPPKNETPTPGASGVDPCAAGFAHRRSHTRMDIGYWIIQR